MKTASFFRQRWDFCSIPIIAVVFSLLALITIVHMFFFPLVPNPLHSFFNPPSNGSDSIHNTKTNNNNNNNNYNVSVHVPPPSRLIEDSADFDYRVPVDSHGAVVYRNAPWKAGIGKWLSGCDAFTEDVPINEGGEQTIGSNTCPNDCNRQGVCNHELGECRCFHGYQGEDCSEKLQLSCNREASAEHPFGRWIVTMCPAHCDTTKAMCFCGEGTKYPDRHVAEQCGFKINLPLKPGEPKMTNWSMADPEIFSNDSTAVGWCNVNPEDAYVDKVKYKNDCECKYDCSWGRFCEIPTNCSCINQCSGHGHCRGGFCECQGGWYGIDCSIPSISSSIYDVPQWLRPATVHVPTNSSNGPVSISALVKRKRPLIYVYDLPPEFNSQLIEGRHFQYHCVNRLYDARNATFWIDNLYGAQIDLLESILSSPHRTLNGDEADFFFVPVLDSCLIARAGDSLHLSMQDVGGMRSSLTLNFYKKAYDHIKDHYTYWNRSSGRDHIWSFTWDEGACYAPKEIWTSMMLVHWGNTNTKHKNSTTAYWADNWDHIDPEKRGDHPCFDPEKDLVIPAWKRPDPGPLRARLWTRALGERNKLFYFNGNLGPAYYGRPEETYSMGIRQKVAAEFASIPNKNGNLGRQSTPDVIVTSIRSPNYFQELSSSVFCGVFPGDGWSGRMEDSILRGCIPVIFQDGVFLPYENVLNYDSFAVRISEDDIPNLVKILQAINGTEREFKLANVRNVWRRFLYQDSTILEAEREKQKGHMEDWAMEFLKLDKEDDVFLTVIQVLHYKLHNDPWRKNHKSEVVKNYGLPKTCFKNSI